MTQFVCTYIKFVQADIYFGYYLLILENKEQGEKSEENNFGPDEMEILIK